MPVHRLQTSKPSAAEAQASRSQQEEASQAVDCSTVERKKEHRTKARDSPFPHHSTGITICKQE